MPNLVERDEKSMIATVKHHLDSMALHEFRLYGREMMRRPLETLDPEELQLVLFLTDPQQQD